MRPSTAFGRGRGPGIVVLTPRPTEPPQLEAFLISTGLVAVAEIGDKTQLLAIMLAARFRRPWPIVMGILVATSLNHTLAAGAGVLAARFIEGRAFQLLVGVGFLAMALWALIPDKEDEKAGASRAGSVFLTTLVAFFLVEIGDKTQVATTLLGARFHNVVAVAAGTTVGMMIANVPAVLVGEAATRVVPLKYVRLGAALVFALIGVGVVAATLLD